MRDDLATRSVYTSDASIYRRLPAAVIEPRSVDDIREAIELARANGWPITARGGGTSVAGNAIGDGLVIDTSRYFNRILEIDPVAMTATIEPGVVCDQLRSGELVALFPEEATAPASPGMPAIHAVRLPGRSHATKARLFIDHLRAEIGETPWWDRLLLGEPAAVALTA